MYVEDIKLAGKKQNIGPMWKILVKDVDLGEPTSCFDHVYLSSTQRECQTSKDIVDNHRKTFESQISAEATEKLPYSEKLGASDMEGDAKKCVERLRIGEQKQLNSYTTRQHHALTTKLFKEEENEICWRNVKSLLTDCSKMPVFGPHW